jgi:RimJ/RimL family protein N-acetyltransferase
VSSAFAAEIRLAGAHIALRPFLPDDAETIAAAIEAGEEFLPASAATRATGVEWWLTEGVHKVRRSGWGVHLAVIDRATGTLAGAIGLFRADWVVRSAEVAYGVRPAWRGRGLATDALRALAHWALREYGMRRIELRADSANAASIRVAEKAGFHREGVLRQVEAGPDGNRDQVVFSMIPADLTRADSRS